MLISCGLLVNIDIAFLNTFENKKQRELSSFGHIL